MCMSLFFIVKLSKAAAGLPLSYSVYLTGVPLNSSRVRSLFLEIRQGDPLDAKPSITTQKRSKPNTEHTVVLYKCKYRDIELRNFHACYNPIYGNSK